MGVTPAAEVGEGADRVERDRLAFGYFARNFDLVRVASKALDRLFARDTLAGHHVIGRDDFVHTRLESRQIAGRERRAPIEVVIEAVFDRRADGGFRFGEKILHRVGEDMRGRMPQGIERRSVVSMGRGEHGAQVRPATA